ncbi:hypothetical protein B0H10DRAFT_2166207 [Mycena sp. CBHHK59/15]|nr:hypothetical protein B0H10DRAFT_2166207 [Mycena sp. CBHHK59/15]
MSSETGLEKSVSNESGSAPLEIDLLTFHEHRAGHLVIDPEEAKVELSEAVASRLKLYSDGTKVLWPQPMDSPLDPQNWSNRHKALKLIIIMLASIVPDFDSGIGITSIFALSEQCETGPGVINNLTSNWSIFLIGWGGIFAVILILSVTLTLQVCSLTESRDTVLGDALFARCLMGFFGTAPQITGLYVVTDMYLFYLQAQKLNIWTFRYLLSILVPTVFGFLVARTTCCWAYGTSTMYRALVCLLIILFGEEACITLICLAGLKMAKYCTSWYQAISSPILIIWWPQLIGILFFKASPHPFGLFSVTNTVFLGTLPPFGFGFSVFVISGLYATPIVSVLVGELTGHYANDWIMNLLIHPNSSVFKANSHLWACYIAVPLYICGFMVLGAALQNHLGVAALIMMAVIVYCSNSFPKHQAQETTRCTMSMERVQHGIHAVCETYASPLCGLSQHHMTIPQGMTSSESFHTAGSNYNILFCMFCGDHLLCRDLKVVWDVVWL